MSAVQVQGNASGTGTLTIASPNTNTNRTLTLPDASGVLGAYPQIYSVTASVASSALTVTLNPCALDFRSTPITSGTVNTRTVSAAISVVVPSTATLGTVSAVQSRIVVLALDNGGTVELAVVNISGGTNLDETTLISTTAIAAGSNTATVVYSTTARTSLPYRVVGYIESTQATAGTWATAPSTIQGYGGQALAAMSSLGYGQTWQVVTRTSGTTYYNTTSKPITCFITFDVSSNWTINVNGYQLGTSSATSASNRSETTFIVPIGQSYVLTLSAGSATKVSELR